MNTTKHISSTQNSLFKKMLHLKEKSRERKKTGLFLVEGQRELSMVLKGDYFVETICFCEQLLSQLAVEKLLPSQNSIENISLSIDCYKKLVYRETTEGVIAIVRAKTHTLDTIQLKNRNPLILVAEAPEKPGNIGALLRTADAANLDAVLIANPKTDLYNPNIIRSSVGCVFSRTIATGTTTEILAYLKALPCTIYCASLAASEIYTAVSYATATAIVVGTEATGLSKGWLDNATKNIRIPMEGAIDSMNVSVAAAILVFEGKRQRS